MYSKWRRKRPENNKIIWEELQTISKAGVIVLATSEWSSLVVIIKKKDAEQRLCVEYRFINRLMKNYRWPILKIEEVFHDLIDDRLFTTLDLFSGYWKIKISEGFKEKTKFVCHFGTFR